MRTVLYPGSFDPLTNGHLDLIERAASLFDNVIVAVAVNSEKNSLFTLEERELIIKECCAHLSKVRVVSFRGLLVNELVKYEANAVLRGLRAFSDFEYELQMALMNRSLNPACETIFLKTKKKNSFVSSRLVKEVARLGGDYAKYVPPQVVKYVDQKLNLRRGE